MAVAVNVLFFSAIPSYAVSIRNGSTVRIPKNETVNESILLGGNSITIDGIVDGDVFCGGQDIVINGVVNGDVICGGQSIIISGQIKGNVRAAGQTVLINGIVDRNVNLFGQQVRMSSSSAIAGEAFIGSQNADIDGSIGKKLSGGAQSLNINGAVDDVYIEAQNVSVGSTANIKKNLTYVSDTKAEIATSSSVQGTTLQKVPPKATSKGPAERNREVWSSVWSAARVTSLIAQIILAFIVLYFIPKHIKKASLTMQERISPTFGYGLLILFLAPIIMVVFVLTIIGIPLAMILLLLFMVSFLISRILVAMVVGRVLLERFWADKKDNNYWTAGVGLTAMWIIFSIPFIGGLLGFISLIWGLGGVYYLLRRNNAS